MASEEKTSAADIPLKSHQEVTSAASIPLKSHEEVVPWTMAREEIQLEGCAADFPVQIRGCAADFPVKSNREVENQIVGCAADFPVPIDGCAADFPVQIDGCAADFPVKSNREQGIQNNHRTETVGTSSTDQSHEVSLHIKEIATSLRDHLETKKVFSRACCIYRVPARLRELNEKAYTPRVVSIGPLHHGKENLKAMEDHKIMYLQQFLEWSKVSVEDLIKVVRDNETELRDCYAETIDLSRKDFATMILLDAVFIIMVLLKFNYVGESLESGSGDQIFSPPFKFVDVVFDMCLLENQLPFFLLEKLFELYPMTNCTIMGLTFNLLQGKWYNWVKEDSRKKINSSKVLHFVDFLRKCQQPREHLLEFGFSSVPVPTAMELHQSGVKFKNPEGKSPFDITFSNGILEIPRLTIDDDTQTLFRNLQAFEQCHLYEEEKFVSDYITFTNCLIRAPSDVEVLPHHENLKDLLYNLQQGNVISENSFLGGVCIHLYSHCRNPRHKWKATLKMVYFNNPWSGISVAAAAFLLILTVIQTVCSILQL